MFLLWWLVVVVFRSRVGKSFRESQRHCVFLRSGLCFMLYNFEMHAWLVECLKDDRTLHVYSIANYTDLK